MSTALRMKYFLPVFAILNYYSEHIVPVATKWDPASDECKMIRSSPQKPLCIPTLRGPSDFSPEIYAKAFHDALWKKNNTVIMDIITKRTRVQRWHIVQEYQRFAKTSNDEDNLHIFEDMNRKMDRGHFKDLMISLLKPIELLYAVDLHDILTAAITNLSKLMEILGPMSNKGIDAVNTVYRYKYGKNLGYDTEKIIAKASNECRDLFVYIATGKRVETPISSDHIVAVSATALLDAGIFKSFDEMIANDAKSLQTAESGSVTNLGTFNNLISVMDHNYIKKVIDKFEELEKRSLQESLEKGSDKDWGEALIALYKISQDRAKYFAERLRLSFRKKWGLFIDHRTLLRIITGRAEIDLHSIKVAYELTYNHSLASMIQREVSGNYKEALLSLLAE